MSEPTEIVPLVMFDGDGPMKMARLSGPISDPVEPVPAPSEALSDADANTPPPGPDTADAADGGPSGPTDATAKTSSKTGKS